MKGYTSATRRGILLAALLAGCGQAGVDSQNEQQGVTVAVSPSAPQVRPLDTIGFTASVTSTADLRVTWAVTEASGGAVDSSGLYTAPATPGTYHVVATSVAVPTASGQATVNVVAVVSPPTISSFTASPSSVSSGGASTLAWSVSGATTLSINQGVGTVTGPSVVVHPSATTTYTLTATNAGGSSTASATVTVTAAPVPVISSFTASPSSVTSGGASTLAWSVTGANSLSINPGVGTVTGTSLVVRPSATTTYTLTATNATGNSTASATVTVTPAAVPVISSFTASPSSVTSGGASTLAWNVSGAASLSINQGVGTVAGTSVVVHPSATTTYTLTATNAAGNSTATVVVTVTGGASGTDYHVGPGQAYVNIGDVPWYALQAGDTVYIHYRATPYREKFLISTRGTESQWFRVLGVPGPNGELPVISGDGAVTSRNSHYYWADPTIIQYSGVVQIAVSTNGAGSPVPGYIEIANLKIQDTGTVSSGSWRGYTFTAENGTTQRYEAFSACLYARSPQNLLVHDCEFTNCGQGFYNWTGAGTTPLYWDALAKNMTIRDNYFHGNSTNGWTEHQIYTEGDTTIIEGNRFGAQRAGALGSQIKDRSAGTVIRYNWIEQSQNGWDIDLVEPENGWGGLGFSNPKYRTAFVYGNVIQSTGQSSDPNYFHWNEDHQTQGNPNAQPGGAGPGRAVWPGSPPGKLFFYNNTVVTDQSVAWHIFNITFGAYECPGGSPTGVIDVRNNLIVTRPGTTSPPAMAWAYCGQENFDFGVNWVSPGYNSNGHTVTGLSNLVSPAGNDPGLTNRAGFDYTLSAGSSALGIGAALPSDVTNNALGLDLTPTMQLNPTTKQGRIPRAQSGAGSDAGAFER